MNGFFRYWYSGTYDSEDIINLGSSRSTFEFRTTMQIPLFKNLTENATWLEVFPTLQFYTKNKETIKLLRQMQQELFEINEAHKNSVNRYLFTIEPLTNNYLNYTSVQTAAKKAMLVEGGPETDYEYFYNNMVLWNLLSQKLEDYQLQLIRQHAFLDLLKNLKENLKSQLN